MAKITPAMERAHVRELVARAEAAGLDPAIIAEVAAGNLTERDVSDEINELTAEIPSPARAPLP